jgi:hypothetical protein
MAFLVVVHSDDPEEVRTLNSEHRVVGVYRLPAREVATCAGNCGRSRRHLTGWGRHSDSGHIVHADCRQRTHAWRKTLSGALFDALGINLLKRTNTPTLFQNPEGWGK